MDAVKPCALLIVKELGRQDYQPVWHEMQALTDHRNQETTDQLWFVEHPPVFTQGKS